MERIFVSIASYRDPETPATLRDLFAKAAHPERVFAGVLWQADPGEDEDCGAVPINVPSGNLRGLHIHPRDSLGVCWARHRILTELRRDEEFVLQIDSHMRFAAGWDEKLLTMWRACRSSRAILSTYPVPYTLPDKLGDPVIPVMTAHKFNHRGILMPLARSLDYNLRPARPLPNPFVSAGFLFAPAAAFDEVPYDERLYFIGEEISLAARLWTHGWDAYTPNEVVVYHLYGRGTGRPCHWSDHPDWQRRDTLSLMRLRHLLGIETAQDPMAICELERHGLGTARTLEDFMRYADVDLRRQKIGPAGHCGRFAPHPTPDCLAMQRVFTNIFENNLWKAWETRSGTGSTLKATIGLVPALAQFCEARNIRSLVDAGCGDCNWIADLAEQVGCYFGLDVVEPLTMQNARLHGRLPGWFFKTADITCDALPRADAILCRNVLSHLTLAQTLAALDNFRRSGCRWLIATTHDGVEQNHDTDCGKWRPLNLHIAPFLLPPPIHRIPDGTGRWLDIWKLG